MKTWAELGFWETSAWRSLDTYLSKNAENYYPSRQRVFKSLLLTPLDKVRAVIVGQDPYHNGQADGLAFSCKDTLNKCPSATKTILKEYHNDLKLPLPKTGDLSPWANQGVLLLNTNLTVSTKKPHSHNSKNWKWLTEEILRTINRRNRRAVFLLFGSRAHKLALSTIRGTGALVVTCPHPGPSSEKEFNNTRPFTKCNSLLQFEQIRPIDWDLGS